MRKLLLALLAFFLLAFAALSPLVLHRPCPVTEAAFDRIEEGMTLADVEAILGGPPGDYTTRPPGWDYDLLVPPIEAGARQTLLKWNGDEGEVDLVLDERGIVVNKWWKVQGRLQQDPLDLLLWRFERWRVRTFGGSSP